MNIVITDDLIEKTKDIEEAYILAFLISANKKLTINEIIEGIKLKVSSMTLRRKIKNLVKQGLIEKITQNKKLDVYEVVVESQIEMIVSSVDEVLDVVKNEEDLLKNQISYDELLESYSPKSNDIGILNNVFDSLMSVIGCNNKDSIKINGRQLNVKLVKYVLYRKLKCDHVREAIQRFKNYNKSIKNINGFIISLIYNIVTEDTTRVINDTYA